MDFLQTFCILDPQNRIRSVGGAWDDFARANGGAAATGMFVTGRLLLDHVAGTETRDFVRAALAAVRGSGRDLRLDYRCDSPGIRRFMKMSLSRLEGDRVLMVHDFVGEEHVAGARTGWVQSREAVARKCSICCSIETGGIWLDPFLSGEPHPARVRHVLCPECSRLAQEFPAVPRRAQAGGVVIRFEPHRRPR